MRGSVTQACRTLHSGDEKYGFRCRRVPFILTSFCLAPFGNENGLKCRLKVSCCTLGRRKCATVLPKRVVLHSRATKMLGSVTQACRTLHSGDEKYGFRCRGVPFILTSFCLAPFGNENGLKCRLKVSYCTLGRQKGAEVLPESVVLHPRATKMRDSVTQACRTLLSGDEKYGFRCRGVPFILTSFCLAPFGNENGLKCRLNVSYCTLGRRKSAKVSPKSAALHSRATKSVGFVAQEPPSSLRHPALHPRATKMDGSVA